MNADKIIDALGGTLKVATLCEVKPPSVSEWRKNGIPRARIMFLMAVRPDLFDKNSKSAPCSMLDKHPCEKTY